MSQQITIPREESENDPIEDVGPGIGGDIEREIDPERQTVEDRLSVATQRQLIWWRFRRHKVALASLVIVAMFYLVP